VGRTFRAEAELHTFDAAAQLSQICVGLMEGTVTITGDGRSRSFEPGPVVKLEVSFDEDDGRAKMQIELTWKTPLTIANQPHVAACATRDSKK
jgi:amphi-Trp domain-containing protein